MRTALEWINEVGESAGQDMFCGPPKIPGSRTEKTIRRIQVDALAHAGEICLRVAESLTKHDATDCARAILAEAEKLEI